MNLLKEKTVAEQLLEALDDGKEQKRFSVLKQVSEEGDFECMLETDSIQEAAAKVEEIEFKDNAYSFVLDNISGEAIEKEELAKSLIKDIDEEDEDLFECSLEESHMSDIDVTRQELERLLQDKREALDVMEMRHDPSEREDIEELKSDIREISDILNDIEDGKLADIQKRAAKHLGEELIEAVDEQENIPNEEIHDDEHKCCICGGPLGKYGNNAEPVKSGKCCDDCNIDVVIPARLNASKNNRIIEEDKEETITYSIVKIDTEYVPSVENYSTESEVDAVIDELKEMSDEELYNADILGYAQLDIYNDNIDVIDYYISEKADFYKAQEALNSVSSVAEDYDSEYEYDWYEDYDTHPLIDQYEAACDQLNVWAEGSTQGRTGRVDFLENDTDMPRYRVDYEDEIDFMNSLDPNEDNVEAIKSFIADHSVSEDLVEAKEIKYDYGDAVDYIELNDISCDPCSYDYAEYVCDRLDMDVDGYDRYGEPYYYQSTLDSIIEDTKEYIKRMQEGDLDESLLEKRRKKRKRKAQGWFVNYNAGNVEHNNDFFNHANGSDCESCGEAAGMGEALDVEESDLHRGARLIPSSNLGSWTKEEVLDELKADLDTIYDQGYFDEGDIISIEEVITDDEGYFIIDTRSHGKANYELIGGRLYNYEAPEQTEE